MGKLEVTVSPNVTFLMILLVAVQILTLSVGSVRRTVLPMRVILLGAVI